MRSVLVFLTLWAVVVLGLFVGEHGRLPAGSGEALNWMLGL